MSKKGAKKGKATLSRQQQQQAAAARRRPSPARSAAGQPSTSSDRTDASEQLPAGPVAKAHVISTDRRYLDISAVRIQEWLARTPDLKFRRGASVMLSEVTGHDAWPDVKLPPGTRWNTEAGDLDGVISLVADDKAGEADADRVVAAAGAVAQTLRRALPHCHIQAVTGRGDSYASAYSEIEQARRDGYPLLDAPPAPAETILAKPCDQCRDAPAETAGVEIVGQEKREDLCAECRERVKAAGGTKGGWERRSPRPERRMKAALQAAGRDARFPDDFSQLAEAGRRADDDAATQLALIYADGNRVGEFLAETAVHARNHGSPAKADIVPTLDTATLAALADAVIHCFASSQRTPVLAHIAGGDDLMVSVPAADAWPFVRSLLAAFGQRIGAVDWPAAILEHLPSMSAGIVFHHKAAPFPDVVRLVREQLVMAKARTQGKRPSVAFLDLTADGDRAPASRRPLPLADLDKLAALLTEIAGVPKSHRENLVALQRLSEEEQDAADEPGGRAETPAEALARRVADLGYPPLWAAVAGSAATAQDVRIRLESSAQARSDLRGFLDLARWWPASDVVKGTVPRERQGSDPKVGQEVSA